MTTDRDAVAALIGASAPRESSISDRNRAAERLAPEATAGDDLVELDALAIVRLARTAAGRAARRAVLSALRADLASLKRD